ncbi:hypothetical protein J6590_028020 [Homalodisca vitripennis]|nr:hypothetical protein J6590_028020 [Homalodisca vitripennis]
MVGHVQAQKYELFPVQTDGGGSSGRYLDHETSSLTSFHLPRAATVTRAGSRHRVARRRLPSDGPGHTRPHPDTILISAFIAINLITLVLNLVIVYFVIHPELIELIRRFVHFIYTQMLSRDARVWDNAAASGAARSKNAAPTKNQTVHTGTSRPHELAK